jgi:hypothetical protein
MRQISDSTSTKAGDTTRRHVTFAPTAIAALPTRPSRRQSNHGRGNRGGRAERTGAVSTTGAASSTVDSGSGGSGSNGSDSANGSSGALDSSYSSIIEGPAPASCSNQDPSLANPCPVGGSIHTTSSDMSSSSTSMTQDATVDHRSAGNEGEGELRSSSKSSSQTTRKLRARTAMLDK